MYNWPDGALTVGEMQWAGSVEFNGMYRAGFIIASDGIAKESQLWLFDGRKFRRYLDNHAIGELLIAAHDCGMRFEPDISL